MESRAALAASIEKRAAAYGVAGGERVLGEHGQAGRGWVATVEQQVDDRGVDLPSTRRRNLVRGELTDLLVRERVVGGLALRLREQETGPDGGREIVRERVGSVARGSRLALHGGRRGPGVVVGGRVRCDDAIAQARSDHSEGPAG